MAEKKVAAPAKKVAAPKKATVAKKAPAKKAPAKKTVAAPKKAASLESTITYQFADKEYDLNSLTNIAKDVWTYDYDKKVSDLKKIQLFVKPEENKVYYVFNDEIEGAFDI